MTDIVTLDEYKTYMSINSVNQNEIITQLIPQVTSYIKTYCGRTFVDYYATNKIDVYSGGTDRLLPKEWPLIQVVSLEYSYDNGQTYTTLNEFVDWVYEPETESVVPIGSSKGFQKLTNGFRLTYRAGYADYPPELKLAAMDMITYCIRSDMAVKSTRSPGSNSTQIEYVMNSGLPSHIRRILDLYRNGY